jgi:hypothetical protein
MWETKSALKKNLITPRMEIYQRAILGSSFNLITVPPSTVRTLLKATIFRMQLAPTGRG